MTVNYHLTETDDSAFLVVVSPEGQPLVATTETHGNFDELVKAARAGDESVFDLFDTGRAIEKKFRDAQYGRIAVRGGQVYFDDDILDNAIVEKILDFHEQGAPVDPLAAYVENVMANPQEHSREQFYRWIANHHFPISDDGCIVAYKAVRREGDKYVSKNSGHAFVNGVEFGETDANGNVVKAAPIPQNVGDVVTMPRSEVAHDPHVACHTGLHAGTWEYVQWFGGRKNDPVMLVKINPRDVVSVPNDSSSQKVRVCRYEVIGFATSKSEALRYVDEVVVGDAEAVKTEDETVLDKPVAKAKPAPKPVVVPKRGKPAPHSGKWHVGDKVVVKVGKRRPEHLLRPHLGKEFVVSDESIGFNPSPRDGFVITTKGNSFWDDELVFVKPTKVDTRTNHTRQKRGPGGRFLPKGS